MKTSIFVAAAAAILAGENAMPIKTQLTEFERNALRSFINQQTTKRAKVKAARKQRNKANG